MKRMRTLLWFVAATILTFLLANSGFAFQNEPEDFRGVKWGDRPTEDMVYYGSLGGNARGYTRPYDKMRLGDAKGFYRIVYMFYDVPGRFWSVCLYFKGKRTFDQLKLICRGKFGEETKEGFYSLYWEGQQTIIRLEYDIIEGVGELDLRHVEIWREWSKAKQQEEAEKAEGDW